MVLSLVLVLDWVETLQQELPVGEMLERLNLNETRVVLDTLGSVFSVFLGKATARILNPLSASLDRELNPKHPCE